MQNPPEWIQKKGELILRGPGLEETLSRFEGLETFVQNLYRVHLSLSQSDDESSLVVELPLEKLRVAYAKKQTSQQHLKNLFYDMKAIDDLVTDMPLEDEDATFFTRANIRGLTQMRRELFDYESYKDRYDIPYFDFLFYTAIESSVKEHIGESGYAAPSSKEEMMNRINQHKQKVVLRDNFQRY